MYEGSAIQQTYDRVWGKSPARPRLDELGLRRDSPFTPSKQRNCPAKENSTSYLNRSGLEHLAESPVLASRTAAKLSEKNPYFAKSRVSNEDWLYGHKGTPRSPSQPRAREAASPESQPLPRQLARPARNPGPAAASHAAPLLPKTPARPARPQPRLPS